MARILFVMTANSGHLMPTFRLAKDLIKRGHRVMYAGLTVGAELVRAQGLEYYPALDSITRVPPGLAGYRLYWKIVEQVLDGEEFRRIIAHAEPDLAVVDTDQPLVALLCHAHRIPLTLVNTAYPSSRDAWVPPCTTALVPEPQRWGSRLLMSLHWRKLLLRRRVTNAALAIARLPSMTAVLTLGARKCGYPLEGIDFQTALEGLRLKLPEIVLAPVELDLPRQHPIPGCQYAAPCVDLERRADDPFPWDRVEADKRIVFCTLGSRPNKYPNRVAFYQSAIDAVASRPGLQLIAAIGSLAPSELREAGNAILVPFAPQLEILKRSALMIVHGGLNTIKECIYLGVPMVVYPTLMDQPGNAARVAYHRLGVVGDMRRVTPTSVGRLLDQVLGDPGYQQRVQEMGRVFREADDRGAAIDLIEAALPSAAAA
jgi:UDP:flavonoid glycosyltransferase YjiC (YdhE family)